MGLGDEVGSRAASDIGYVAHPGAERFHGLVVWYLETGFIYMSSEKS